MRWSKPHREVSRCAYFIWCVPRLSDPRVASTLSISHRPTLLSKSYYYLLLPRHSQKQKKNLLIPF